MTWTSQHLLNAVAQATPDDCLTEARMADMTGLTLKQVENCAYRLRQAGFLYRGDRDCHRITIAGLDAWRAGQRIVSGPKGPQASGHRQLAWNVLRLGKKVTVDDILLLILDGEERDPAGNLGKYLRALARTGYLRRLAMRDNPATPSSNGAIRWLLVRDTGPRAPVRKRDGRVYDPNTETTHEPGELATVPKARRA